MKMRFLDGQILIFFVRFQFEKNKVMSKSFVILISVTSVHRARFPTTRNGCEEIFSLISVEFPSGTVPSRASRRHRRERSRRRPGGLQPPPRPPPVTSPGSSRPSSATNLRTESSLPRSVPLVLGWSLVSSNLVIFRSARLVETMGTQPSLAMWAGALPGTLTASSYPRSTW